MALGRFLLVLLFHIGLLNSVFAQNYIMNGVPVNDCSGFFLDSGGNNGDYRANENFVTTICADGSGRSHIKLTFSGVEINPGDELCFYDDISVNPGRLLSCASEFTPRTPFIIQASAANPSGCITISFRSNASGEGPGWSASISCVPSCQKIESVLDSSIPVSAPTDNGWIDACPGEAISFSGRGNYIQNNLNYFQSDGTSTFEWDFGDGAKGFGTDVSHTYKEPGGYTVQLRITDSRGCTSTNFLNQRVRISTPPVFEMGLQDISICAGDTVELHASNGSYDPNKIVSVSPTTGHFSNGGSRSDSLALPDGTGSSYATGILVTGFSPGQTLSSVDDLESICVNIEHSWMRDMEISISCPDGSTAILHDHPGNVGGMVLLGEPVDFDTSVPIPGVGYEYCWTADATRGTWLEYANATFGLFGSGTLPAGNFNSFQPLSNLIGCPLNGEWTIKVQDLWAQDNGFIFSWGINFRTDLYPSLETFSPSLTSSEWLYNPTVIQKGADYIIASPPNAGTVNYTYSVNNEFGCSFDTIILVEVLPETHPDCHHCDEIIQPLEDTLICNGESIQLDVTTNNSLNKPITFETFPNETIGFDNYPPANPFESGIEVNHILPSSLYNISEQIESVCIDITTDFVWDLQVFLVSPSGKRLELTTNNGGIGSYIRTCFTPDAPGNIRDGVAPFTGNYQPEGDWNTLLDSPVNGLWQLSIGDATGTGEFGTVNNWSITFRNQNTVSYQWPDDGIISCTDCPNPVVTPHHSGQLSVEVTDSYGCLHQDTMFLNVFTAPAPQPVCGLSENGNIAFNWNSIPHSTGYEVNINNQGWNDVSGTSFTAGGFQSGDSAVVELRTLFDNGCYSETGSITCLYLACELNIDIEKEDISCFGNTDGSFIVHASNGQAPYSFSMNGGPSQSDSTFSNLSEGIYEVIITDGLDCRDTVTVEIFEPVQLQVNAIQVQPARCFGFSDGIAEATATGGDGNYMYMWNDPLSQSGRTATSLPAGNYTVTVLDGNGCQATANVTISQPPQIMLSFETTNVSCRGESGGSIILTTTGGIPPYSFVWNDPLNQTSDTIRNLPAGTYTVTVTDNNGCTRSAFTTITQPPTLVQANAAQVVEGCYGFGQSEATVTASGGAGAPFTYLWSDGQQTQTAVNLLAEEYFVTVTDQNGCEGVDTIQIRELDPIQVSFGLSLPNCFGEETGGIGITDVIGGSGFFTNSGFRWNTGETGRVIQNVAGGQEYSVTITDNQGCMGDTTIFLEQPDPVIIILDSTAVKCHGGTDGAVTIVEVQTINDIISYQWDANAGNQTTPEVTGLPAGIYTVTVTDDMNCRGIGTIRVTEPQPLQLSFEIKNNDCFGVAEGRVKAVPSGGVSGAGNSYSLTWSTGQTSLIIDNLISGMYVLTITDANNCELTDTAEVEEADPIEADFLTENVVCHGDRDGKLTIMAEGGFPPYLYSLNGINFNGSSTQIGLRAGDYDVYIKDSKGCIYIDKISIFQPDLFEVDAGRSLVEIEPGESIQLSASSSNGQGEVIFTWAGTYTGTLSCEICSDPIATPPGNIVYTLTGEDESGCIATDRLEVRVTVERIVEVPTGFTPNGDGNNDLLLVHGKEGALVELFQVYDRWGELLFENSDFEVNDPMAGWDGHFRGKPMNTGVYHWYVKVLFSDGMEKSYKGSTTLIR